MFSVSGKYLMIHSNYQWGIENTVNNDRLKKSKNQIINHQIQFIFLFFDFAYQITLFIYIHF